MYYYNIHNMCVRVCIQVTNTCIFSCVCLVSANETKIKREK